MARYTRKDSFWRGGYSPSDQIEAEEVVTSLGLTLAETVSQYDDVTGEWRIYTVVGDPRSVLTLRASRNPTTGQWTRL